MRRRLWVGIRAVGMVALFVIFVKGFGYVLGVGVVLLAGDQHDKMGAVIRAGNVGRLSCLDIYDGKFQLPVGVVHKGSLVLRNMSKVIWYDIKILDKRKERIAFKYFLESGCEVIFSDMESACQYTVFALDAGNHEVRGLGMIKVVK